MVQGTARLVAHIKRLHLSLDERKGSLRDVVFTDYDLFISIGEALRPQISSYAGCVCV